MYVLDLAHDDDSIQVGDEKNINQYFWHSLLVLDFENMGSAKFYFH